MIQLKVPQYLDELDPKSLTDDQRAELNDLYTRDPYTFYALWRNPAAAQRWAEGEGFKTEPVNEVFQKIGALRMADAPEHVIEFWKNFLDHHNRPSEDWSDFPPKTKPVPEKLQRVAELCKYLDGQLNWVENNLENDNPEEDLPETVPMSGRWTRLMQRAVGNLVTEHHDGTVRHYKETEDGIQANMGVEVIEIQLEPDATFDIDIEEWGQNYIVPEACSVDNSGTGTRIKLQFYHCYE